MAWSSGGLPGLGLLQVRRLADQRQHDTRLPVGQHHLHRLRMRLQRQQGKLRLLRLRERLLQWVLPVLLLVRRQRQRHDLQLRRCTMPALQ